MSDLRHRGQKLRNGRKLADIEMFEHRNCLVPNRLEHGMDVANPIRRRLQDLFAPVVGVRFPANKANLFQSGHDASDCPGRQAGDCCKVASGHRTVLAQQIETLLIGWADAQVLGDGMMQQDNGNPMPTGQPLNDFLDQFLFGLAHR